MSICILGTSHTKFGSLTGGIYDLIIANGKEAFLDAKMNKKDIEDVWIANYGSLDFNNQGHLGPANIEINPTLRFKLAAKVENACTSSPTTILQAVNAIESNRVKFALVVWVEKMTSLDTKGITQVLAKGFFGKLKVHKE